MSSKNVKNKEYKKNFAPNIKKYLIKNISRVKLFFSRYEEWCPSTMSFIYR